ncbi:MAG: hypothetical protein IT364_20320 [Candidatus Hydrogenedentes bacterium]|nr:hypothetical protein [Candidatus Hydrogenedentota bacterium]
MRPITRRRFMAEAGTLAGVGAGLLPRVAAIDEYGAGVLLLHDALRRWVLAFDDQAGVSFLGLDSEGTGREGVNLLAAPILPSWTNAELDSAEWDTTRNDEWRCSIPELQGRGAVYWSIRREGDDLEWRLTYEGEGVVEGLCVALPISALLAAAVLLPASVDSSKRGLGPWLLVAPDFGHLLVEVESSQPWFAVNEGVRGSSGGQSGPPEGVDPRLKGAAWLEAVGLSAYTPGTLSLKLVSQDPFRSGELATIRFRPRELEMADGVDRPTWKRIRRAYLNHWQPCGTWAGPGLSQVLANNVLSDPASISLWFYSESMLYYRRPMPGIDLLHLLRGSLDHWLDHGVSGQGHVNAFATMYDLYVSTGACLLVAAWHYWAISGDRVWLSARLPLLHRMADYLLRRDVDGDGLIESYGSGNAGTLRDPERADIWFEMMNFGHKNAWTNAIAYRAFLCLAEMLEAADHPKGAKYYRRHASALRAAYVRHLLSERNGWFVSWISLDGEVHDYCHTFINGMAVAYGIVEPEEGREILSRVAAQSHAIGFDQWRLGVPGNLLPCRKADMIGPRRDIDGEPIRNNFYWPDDLSEAEAFGLRYPNGTIHPALVWPYLLGLQVAGLTEEADRIMDAMLGSVEEGLFQNGVVNVGYAGAEHFYINGRTCGYEGFLPESFNFLMACFTRDPARRDLLLRPLLNRAAEGTA